MLNDEKVALFLLSLDKERIYFNKNVIEKNQRRFYEGNARLNKIMHLAQNIYCAIHDTLLIDTTFYAYDNGAVIPNIQENYGRLLASSKQVNYGLSMEEEKFLTKIFLIFKDAPLEELIEIDHEDPEWQKKHSGFSKPEQRMDTLANVEDYRKRYKDIVSLLNKMDSGVSIV